MLYAFMARIRCEKCGKRHYIPLTVEGKWEGKAPCDGVSNMEFELDPAVLKKLFRSYIKMARVTRTKH